MSTHCDPHNSYSTTNSCLRQQAEPNNVLSSNNSYDWILSLRRLLQDNNDFK